MNRKILIISKYASTFEVGFETRIATIARKMIDKGNDVSIISSDSNHFGNFPKFKKIYNKVKYNKLNLIWIKTYKYSKTISISRVISWIDFEFKLFFLNSKFYSKPDVIIVSSLSLITILNGILLKYKYKSKLIFEIRDIWPLVAIEEGGFSKFNPLIYVLSVIEKIGYSLSDLVVGTMPNLVEHVRKVSFKQTKVECIPFGYEININSNFTEKSLDILKENEFFLNNRFTIAYVGSIGLSNGLNAFVNVIKEFKNENNIGFVFLGDGANKNNYQSILKDFKNVIFLPKVHKSQVPFFLKKFDVLYFSSLKSKVWNYGWSPNKIIDYMVSERPIIASYSGYRSMVDEAECGEFIEAENQEQLKLKILKFYNYDTENLNLMGRNGKKWIIENRSWEKITNKYLDLINKLF